MRITFCSIVLNGNYVFKQALESVYPYAHRIIIVDGAVRYHAMRGLTKSNDGTLEMLRAFPDPENKIEIISGIFEEKTEQCQAFMPHVPADTDYIWCLDSDEVFKPEDIEKTIKVLEEKKPEFVCFNSNTFFGGFNNLISGFEAEHNFKRILRYESGCQYITHRQPTLSCEKPDGVWITGQEMSMYGVRMFHYSYTFPKQVYQKIQYYEDAVISKGNCVSNYFDKLWLPWVLGTPEQRFELETNNKGVHEFKPSIRGEAFTIPFEGDHPKVIQSSMRELLTKFNIQLEFYRKLYNI